MKCSKNQDVQLSEVVLGKELILRIALLMEDVLRKYTDDELIISSSIEINERRCSEFSVRAPSVRKSVISRFSEPEAGT